MPRRAAPAVAAACLAPALAGAVRAQPPAPATRCPASAGPARAAWPAPLDRAVTPGADARTRPLRLELERLAAAAGVRLSYSRELLPLDRPACLDAAPLPLGAALARLLDGTGVAAVAVPPDQVVLAPAPTPTATAIVPVLEQVVVTGSTTAAPARRLPYALTAVEGASLALAGVAPVSLAALNGQVPGLWTWAQPPTALLARFGSLRGASSFGVSTPKVFLDGVELANPLVAADLPPERIDRVEIIRGPQGAALYGADAISGVVNVVTRHDGAGPGARPLTVRTGLGAAGGTFAGRPALAQEHAAFYRAGDGPRTGGLALAASTLGPYAPGAAARRLVATGDLRQVTRTGTVTATLRVGDAATSPALNPLLAFPAADSVARGQRLRQVTAAVTATRAAGGPWTQTFTAGVDAYQLTGVTADDDPLAAVLDSAQRSATGRAGRATLRASTTATLDVRPGLRATLTGVADYGLLRDATSDGTPVAYAPPRGRPNAAFPRAAAGAAAPPAWLSTAGLVGQGTLAVHDAVFVTAGLRGERNDGFTDASRFALLPTLGISALRALGGGAGAGGATVKLRAAAGRGLRPARTLARASVWRGFDAFAAAGNRLGPETQSGVEFGLDLLAGGGSAGRPTFSASVTRFDQRASGLLQAVDGRGFGRRAAGAAGAPPSPPSADDPGAGPGGPATGPAGGPVWNIRRRVENVGVIDNQGWEFEAALQHRALAVGATATLVDSRVRRTVLGYTGDLRAGDRMLQVPARTVGAFATWRGGPWGASAQLARAADWINYDRVALANLPAGTPQPFGAALRRFWLRYPGVTHLGASLTRDLGRGLSAVVAGTNLLDQQRGEPDNLTLLPGRTVTAGVRATF